jgi:hypothetical protein
MSKEWPREQKTRPASLMSGDWQFLTVQRSAKGAAGRRQAGKESCEASGGESDTATVLRALLRNLGRVRNY